MVWRWLWLTVCYFCSCNCIWAQVIIWQEDFDQYLDGDTLAMNLNSGNPELDWFIGGCSICPDSIGDWWEVRNQRLEAHDVNQEVFFQSEAIAINGYQQVSFQMDITEQGDLEGPYFGSDDCVDQDNQDYVDVQFRIDGGPWQVLPNYLSWCALYATCSHTLYGDDGVSGDCRIQDDDWDSVRIEYTGIVGSTLELQVSLINSADDEYITIDNIVVSGQLVLPVEFADLRATTYPNQITLSWNTLTETNSHRFAVYHSPGPQLSPWTQIGAIPAAGNSQWLINYTFIDPQPRLGQNFYRIKQIDFDGQAHWSPIVRASWHHLQPIMLYPTLSDNVVTLSGLNRPQIDQVKLVDLYGRHHKLSWTSTGIRLWQSNLDHLPSGYYQLIQQGARVGQIILKK